MNKPALWARTNFMTRQWAVDFTTEFCDELGKMSGRCIDIGSGPCDVTVDFFVPKLNPKATLVCSDISVEMLAFAKKKYEDKKRLSFHKLDIQTPDLPKDLIEKFNHATSFYCIHFCQDIPQVFENIYNLLRPGGTLLLVFLSRHPGMNSYKELAAIPRYQPYMEDAVRWIPVFQNSKHPEKTVEALVKDVGFEVHHCSAREENYTFDDLNAFAGKICLHTSVSDHVVSANPFIDRIPANLKKEYAKDLAEEWASQCIKHKINPNNEREYSVLCLLRTIVVYLRKPLIKQNSN